VDRHGERHAVGPVDIACFDHIEGDIDSANFMTGCEQRACGLGRVQWLVAQFVAGQQQHSHHLDPNWPPAAPRLASAQAHLEACLGLA